MKDTLITLLILCVSREYNLHEGSTYQTASEKVERRTPYMKEWGDGMTIAKTSKDADRIWQEVKKLEKKKAEKSMELSIRECLEKELLSTDMMSRTNNDKEVSSSCTSADTMKTKLQKISEDQESDFRNETQNHIGMQDADLASYPSDEVRNIVDQEYISSPTSSRENDIDSSVQTKVFETKTSQVSAEDFASVSNGQNLPSPSSSSSSSPPNIPNKIPGNSYQTHVGIHAALGFAAGSLVMAFIQKCRK